MSFSVIRAGNTATVREQVRGVVMQDELGELAQLFVDQVLAIEPAPAVIVEMSGHSDKHSSASVSINIRPVFP